MRPSKAATMSAAALAGFLNGQSIEPAHAGQCGPKVHPIIQGDRPLCDDLDPKGVHRHYTEYCTVKWEVGKGGAVCPGKKISKAEAYKRAGLGE